MVDPAATPDVVYEALRLLDQAGDRIARLETLDL